MFSRQSYEAARSNAAFIDRTEARGRIILTGHDRGGFLQGLLTNDTASLKGGQGCYAAMLTAQGRMIADLWVYELGDVMLVSTVAEVKDIVLTKLDQFIFSEDVQLGDVTATFSQVAVVGPAAAAVVASLLDSVPEEVLAGLPEHGNVRVTIQEQPMIVTRVSDTGVAGFDLLVETTLRNGLMSALTARSVPDASGPVADALRIEGGVPLFGPDMDTETIPLEAGIESKAISFTKGCYVGQEVIIRVLHRGHGRVARRLVGLTFDPAAPVPSAGAVVRSGDRDVGHVTSATFSPALARPIALAYVHRDFVAPGTAVSVDSMAASVTELPLVTHATESQSHDATESQSHRE